MRRFFVGCTYLLLSFWLDRARIGEGVDSGVRLIDLIVDSLHLVVDINNPYAKTKNYSSENQPVHRLVGDAECEERFSRRSRSKRAHLRGLCWLCDAPDGSLRCRTSRSGLRSLFCRRFLSRFLSCSHVFDCSSCLTYRHYTCITSCRAICLCYNLN